MTLDTLEAFHAALKTAKPGDVLELGPGPFAAIGFQGINFATPVTIKSANTAKRSFVSGMEMTNCSGLIISDLEIGINPRTQTAFNVSGSSNVVLQRLDIHGVTAGMQPGVLFTYSTKVSLLDSILHDVGTAMRGNMSTEILISGNTFREIRGDACQFSGSSDVTVRGNKFTDFFPSPGDHPDAIQFFTLNQKEPACNILIEDNVMIRGAGAPVQGIFMGNEIKMYYDGVIIRRNALLGLAYQGISVYYGKNVEISDNFVQGYNEKDNEGRELTSWILAVGCEVSKMLRNKATSYNLNTNTNFINEDNVTISRAPVGQMTELNAFLESLKPIVDPPEPPPSEIDEIAALRLQIAALEAAGLNIVAAQRDELNATKTALAASREALAKIATIATASRVLTSAAKMKPGFDQIIALTK